jgi:hypothetical protein
MRKSAILLILAVFFGMAPLPVFAAAAAEQPASAAAAVAPQEEFRRFKLVFEPDAYYTDLDLIVALTKEPIPQLGDRTESTIYRSLLSRAAILPQFLVLESSINPMPCLGVYVKKHNPDFYDHARISGSFNWVKALTAGFEEPYADSILAGNVLNFHVAGKDIEGLAYSGYLVSTGNYHIKDNELIKDRWWEYEWKVKGDLKSQAKKLSWSFRIGAKLHGNPDITDIIYLSFRRNRLDYQIEKSSLINNSGFEYSIDMDRRTLRPIRHYFYVDKKWPIESRHMAYSLALGFVWESSRKYTGALAGGREKDDVQFIIRPNLEF